LDRTRIEQLAESFQSRVLKIIERDELGLTLRATAHVLLDGLVTFEWQPTSRQVFEARS
jgi:hypothetical protein